MKCININNSLVNKFEIATVSLINWDKVCIVTSFLKNIFKKIKEYTDLGYPLTNTPSSWEAMPTKEVAIAIDLLAK